MQATILILETRREVAEALQSVLSSANFDTIVRPHVEHLADLHIRPAAIIVRVTFEGSVPTHQAVSRLPPDRPPVIAIVRDDDERREAQRLKCDVILRAPDDLSRLQDILEKVAT